jgi:hypothetical protein
MKIPVGPMFSNPSMACLLLLVVMGGCGADAAAPAPAAAGTPAAAPDEAKGEPARSTDNPNEP